MSGVIIDGVQWEHCDGCNGEGTRDFSERGKWVDIRELYFEHPPAPGKPGRDLCGDCARAAATAGKRVSPPGGGVVINLSAILDDQGLYP